MAESTRPGIAPVCPQCGTPIAPDWHWCQQCGFDPEGLRPMSASGEPASPGRAPSSRPSRLTPSKAGPAVLDTPAARGVALPLVVLAAVVVAVTVALVVSRLLGT